MGGICPILVRMPMCPSSHFTRTLPIKQTACHSIWKGNPGCGRVRGKEIVSLEHIERERMRRMGRIPSRDPKRDIEERLQRYLAKKEEAKLRTEAALDRYSQKREQAGEAFAGTLEQLAVKREEEKAERERRIREAVGRLRAKEALIRREVERMAEQAWVLLREAEANTWRAIEAEVARIAAELAEKRQRLELKEAGALEKLLHRMERNKELIREELVRRIEMARQRMEQAAADTFARAERRAAACRSEMMKGTRDPDREEDGFDSGGFIMGFGAFLGELIGNLLKAPFKLVAAWTDSMFLDELGEAVGQAASGSVKLAAAALQGSADLLAGTLAQDERLRDRGIRHLKRTGKSVVRGVIRTVRDTSEQIGQFASGDRMLMRQGAQRLAIRGVVMALPLTLMDGLDLLEDAGTEMADVHFVEPHWVDGYFREDGTYVGGYWRDGDGNPLTTLTLEEGGGYWRTNPDGDPGNNLGSA